MLCKKIQVLQRQPSCNSLQTENHRMNTFQEILHCSNCSSFQHHFTTPVCFPTSLSPLMLPIFAPLNSLKFAVFILQDSHKRTSTCSLLFSQLKLPKVFPVKEHCPKSACYSGSPGNDKQRFMNHLLYIALSTWSAAQESKPGSLQFPA